MEARQHCWYTNKNCVLCCTLQIWFQHSIPLSCVRPCRTELDWNSGRANDGHCWCVTESKYRQSSSLFCCSIKIIFDLLHLQPFAGCMQFSPLSLLVSEVMGKIVDKNTPDEVLAELRLKHIGIVSVVSMSILFPGFTLHFNSVPSQIHTLYPST